MGCYLIFALLCISLASTVSGKGISQCSESEHVKLQEEHLQCTKQVEERYALLAGKFDGTSLPSPAASGHPNSTGFNERDPEVLQICNMLHDVVEKCGKIYQKCLKENEYRSFLDAQLEVFIQLMTRLYNLGAEVSLCEAVQEYERSGRREVVQSTEKCRDDEVKKLTIRYQQCIEDANIDMTSKMMGHQDNHEMAFESLCIGIDQVVHGCGEILIDCYTREQIDETKVGQLEMTKKVFTDLMEEPSHHHHSEAHKDSHWNFDIGKCKAFSNAGSSFKSVAAIYLLSLLISFLLI